MLFRSNTDLLAACHELGVTEVYRVGGAQAVASLAYGVEGIPRVDKIVGPGNLFVALAKRYVFGEVDIDSIAGPSEVIVLADESAHPAFVAADLELVGLDLHHIPGVGAALDLGAQHAQTAVPRFVGELHAGGIEGLEEHQIGRAHV